MGIPQTGWFITENPFTIVDSLIWGLTPISGKLHRLGQNVSYGTGISRKKITGRKRNSLTGV